MIDATVPSTEALIHAGFRRAADGTIEIPMPAASNIAESTVGRHARGPRAAALALLHEAADGRISRYSFADLDGQAGRLAAALHRRGVQRGQPVGIHTGQRPETLIAHLAVYKLGAVATTLSQLYGPETLDHAFRDSGLATVLTERTVWERVSPMLGAAPAPIFLDDDGPDGFDRLIADVGEGVEPVETRGDDPAILMYTSGSTGLPKGLLHGHRILDAYMPTVRLFYNLEMGRPGLRFWTPADWAWVGGLLDLVLPALAEGHTVVSTAHRFDAPTA
ncbi:MAG: AMP-binding protein, partial [Hyphomicrobiaceae bacterium]